MKKEKKPLFSDKFLDELAKEISQYYSEPKAEAENNEDGGSKAGMDQKVK